MKLQLTPPPSHMANLKIVQNISFILKNAKTKLNTTATDYKYYVLFSQFYIPKRDSV